MLRAQKLTLDKSRPKGGLRGTHGLFGSEEWWNNIANGKIRTIVKSGIICGLRYVGQDTPDEANTIEFRLVDDVEVTFDHGGLYANTDQDREQYKIGRTIRYTYVCDELKKPSPNGGVAYTKTCIKVELD
ncbi:MAG: hypothetical protein ABJK59_13750 [Erythrobacter sp.]|uniref:hypothetical protein n=1 Tax=Erythrobacter sp. TaxID=1042 RepID=UPI003298E2D3